MIDLARRGLSKILSERAHKCKDERRRFYFTEKLSIIRKRGEITRRDFSIGAR